MIAFILAATDAGPMIINRLDVQVTDEGAYGVGASLLATGRFEQQDIDGLLGVLHLRRQHHGDGVFALDIGANIGTHTLAWAMAMRGWGRVLAIEAQERVYYALAGNIALNNLFNARALNAVVGASNGWMKIPVLDHERPASFGSLELVPRTEEQIGQTAERYELGRVVAVDNIVDVDERVDLIKIDIEGMEIEALHGAVQTIERCKPALFVEWAKCGDEPLRDLLELRGYVIHKLGVNLLALHRDDPIRAHVKLERGQ